MTRIEELQEQSKKLSAGIQMTLKAASSVSAAVTSTLSLCSTWVYYDDQLRSDLVAALGAYEKRQQEQLDVVNALLAKAEDALRPPEPEHIFNTPEKWFPWEEVDQVAVECSEHEFMVVACTLDAYNTDDYGSLYGPGYRYSGEQCVETAKLLQAGIAVTGAENALVVIKRVED